MNQHIEEIAVAQILVNPEQPREVFGVEGISELAASIESQPFHLWQGGAQQAGHAAPLPDVEHLALRPHRIAFDDGERRLRALKQLGVKTARCLVNDPEDVGDKRRMVLALVANMQRVDLNPIEEAKAFRRLNKELHYTQGRIGVMIGRSTAHVANRLKLLELEPETQEYFASGAISIDQMVIYSLAKLPAKQQTRISAHIAQSGLTVEKTRRLLNKVEKKDSDKIDVPLVRLMHAPAVAMAGAAPQELKIFQELAKKGDLPEWQLVLTAARDVCDACELQDVASTQVCRDCPAVELLKRMVQLAANPAGSGVS